MYTRNMSIHVMYDKIHSSGHWLILIYMEWFIKGLIIARLFTHIDHTLYGWWWFDTFRWENRFYVKLFYRYLAHHQPLAPVTDIDYQFGPNHVTLISTIVTFWYKFVDVVMAAYIECVYVMIDFMTSSHEMTWIFMMMLMMIAV